MIAGMTEESAVEVVVEAVVEAMVGAMMPVVAIDHPRRCLARSRATKPSIPSYALISYHPMYQPALPTQSHP